MAWALLAAGGARAFGALRLDGAIAAAVIGFIVFGWGGIGGALPLLIFFVSASALTKVRARLRPGSEGDDDDGGDGRSAVQVVVNGFVPAIALLGFAATAAPVWLIAFTGALAAVTADTWATELGGLSAGSPVLVTTGRPVAKGRSGAVSLWGTVGGSLGAFVLAVGTGLSMARWPLASISGGDATFSSGPGTVLFLLATAGGGIAGMIGDSFLGATVQARYFCPFCRTETEQARHRCGRTGIFVAGLSFMTNDTVNFAASIIGAGVAVLLWKAFVP